ncbi:MAG TPA: Z1 domain-containing protein [Galbitalea sp.]
MTEATDVLSHCVPPTSPRGTTALLVVGYVQSGKTLSFTTVAALARDNGFGVVIVLAGTTKNLKSQSEDRLEADLGLGQLQTAWTLEKNPAIGDEPELRRIVTNWRRRRDGYSTREKPALLLTVLKNATRLRSAAKVLARLDLAGVPVLVIDDESDQASLNTRARANLMNGGDATSETYDSIVELREALPQHSYLQYTATPQANLLLAISDVLNPSYAKVIAPGDSYTGGRYFFRERPMDVIRELPTLDVFDPDNPPTEAPESLQQALRIFLLGAAAVALAEEQVNRSMMVQASQKTAPHATYAQWLQDLLIAWSGLLRNGDQAVRSQILCDFQSAYDDLSRTVADLPELDELLGVVGEVCDEVRVIQVNSVGAEKNIKWTSDQFWILVGGQKLDRGFTVEGLTVSYVPRNIAENSDVLQQRGRFFGYRASYIGFCRVFLPRSSIQAFSGYVKDEEFLRDSLAKFGGAPLSRWRRSFLLHRDIARLTRTSAVGRRLRRVRLDEGWTYPRSMHETTSDVVHNLELLNGYATALRQDSNLVDMASFPGIVDRRTGSAPNLLSERRQVQEILNFLVELRFSDPVDQMLITSVALALSATDQPISGVDVVLVSDLRTDGQQGRTLGALRKNLFVGRSPEGVIDVNQLRYSGDRALQRNERPTLHLRKVLMRDMEGKLAPVPWIAIHFPSRLAHELVIEEF